MGMNLSFTWPGADFSGMDGTNQLYIDQVLHKALQTWIILELEILGCLMLNCQLFHSQQTLMHLYDLEKMSR